MKYIALFTTIFLWHGAIQAQDIPASDVPTVVKDALMKIHSNPRDVEWEKKGEYYNVEYEIGKNDHELWITPSGEVVKHKEEIASADLPQAIKNKIKSEYGGYRIDDVDKISIKNKVLYKVELEPSRGSSSKKDVDLILDADAKSYEKEAWYKMP